MAQQRSQAPQQPAPPPLAHWRDIIRRKNTHLLFSEDLGPPGTKVLIELVDVAKGNVSGEDGKSEEKICLAFRGRDGKDKTKRLAIGARMSKVLETLFKTSNYHYWRGWITLVVVRTTVFDQKLKHNIETDAIRIVPEFPRNQPPRTTHPVEPPPSEQPPSDQPAEPEMTEDEKRAIERAEAEANRG